MVTPLALSAAESAALAADKPIFVGGHLLEYVDGNPEWNLTGQWTAGAGDITQSVNPTRWAYDRKGVGITKPDFSAVGSAQDVYFVAKLFAGTDDAHTIDLILLLGATFRFCSGNLTVTVSIADAGTFAGATTIASWSGATVDSSLMRIYQIGLTNGPRFNNITYLRVAIHTDNVGGFGSTMPGFQELWVAKRHQMPWWPDLPIDDEGETADVVDFVSTANYRTRYTRSRGQAIYDPFTMRSGGANESPNIITELRALRDETETGTRGLLLIPRPQTKPGRILVMYADPPQFIFPGQGPNEREASLSLFETAPFYRVEANPPR